MREKKPFSPLVVAGWILAGLFGIPVLLFLVALAGEVVKTKPAPRVVKTATAPPAPRPAAPPPTAKPSAEAEPLPYESALALCSIGFAYVQKNPDREAALKVARWSKNFNEMMEHHKRHMVRVKVISVHRDSWEIHRLKKDIVKACRQTAIPPPNFDE